MQLAFASTGWLYRYEAYLIFCSVTIIGVLVGRYGRALWLGKEPGFAPAPGATLKGGTTWMTAAARGMVVVALFALFFPLVLRSTAAFSKTGTACINIYQQQYQMGQFLHKYYDKDATAANDIGAISYFTSGPVLDLWGLGNIKVAKSKKNKYWTPDFLDSLSRESHTKLAIVYDTWFNDSLLHRWTKVATWQIQNNVICGDDTVSFYVVNKGDEADLKKNLMEYAGSLPDGVSVKYY